METAEGGTLTNSFYEVRVTLIPKLEKCTIPPTKLQTNVPDVNGYKVPPRALANQIQEHIKTILCHDQNR